MQFRGGHGRDDVHRRRDPGGDGLRDEGPGAGQVIGVPLFDVDVMAVLAGERPEQLTVRVVGQPSGIEIGTSVRFRDLSARTWEMGDRHGVSFKASRVEPWTAGRSSGEGKAA